MDGIGREGEHGWEDGRGIEDWRKEDGWQMEGEGGGKGWTVEGT